MQGLGLSNSAEFAMGGILATNSPSPVSSDSFPEPDSALMFGDDLNDDVLAGQEDQPQVKRKSRRPPSTAERRATHNAVERARRESLNGRFMDLAGALPNMVNVKRPSKSVIVAKSLEFVQSAQAREQYLMGQNDSLRQEINELRVRLGMAPLAASPVNLNGAIPLPPIVNRARKASSVSSSNDTDSPHMSTPSSLGSLEAAQPPAAAASFAFNHGYASAFPPAAVAPQQPIKEVAAQPTSAATANVPLARPTPTLDVNYLMALSLQQQQQQQNMFNLAGHNLAPHQSFAPWLVLPRHVGGPVAAGGESHWLFS